MAGMTKATLRAQWLGKMLRELREDVGMTLREPADHIRRSTSTLSRYESGMLPVPQDEVRELMNLYGIEGEHQRSAMLQLAEEVTTTGWWDKYAKDVLGSTMDYVWLESRSERIRCFCPMVIGGLLQTRDYAAAMIDAWCPDESQQQTERWLSVRMTRQRVLDGDAPPELSVILDEAVLRRPVGDRMIMAEQLQHLQDVAQCPNIGIHVLPFSSGAYPNPGSEFALFRLSAPFPEVVHVDSAAGTIYLEREDVTRIANLYDRLEGACLSAQESVDIIAAAQQEL